MSEQHKFHLHSFVGKPYFDEERKQWILTADTKEGLVRLAMSDEAFQHLQDEVSRLEERSQQPGYYEPPPPKA